MFSVDDKDLVLYGFKEHCIEKLQLQISTVATYGKVLESYLNRHIVNKIESQDYAAFFDEKRLSEVVIKGNTLRATFLNLLDFLYTENFIVGENNFLKFKNVIETIYRNDSSKVIKKNTEFLTPKEIKNIFSDAVDYKNIEEEKLSPLITALSFFCLYRQNDIEKLNVQDVNMQKRTIRNVRYRENSGLAEYIYMNDKFFEIIESYLKYRDSLNLEFEKLVVYKHKPISNPGMNAAFNLFKRNENKVLVNFKPISSEMLIRSRIFYIIESTDGKDISEIFLLQDSNTFYQDAFKNYIAIKRNEFAKDAVKMHSIDGLFPHNKSPEKVDDPPENNINVINYSPENDINFDDLEDFTMGNNRNHAETKVTIQRLVRNSNMASKLKIIYNHECQLCGNRLRKSDGSYMVEAHHIQPYNKLHQGDDATSNLIVLCPNCHSQFDDFYFAIHPESKEVHCIFEDEEPMHKAMLNLKHSLDKKYLIYAWNLFSEKINVAKQDSREYIQASELVRENVGVN